MKGESELAKDKGGTSTIQSHYNDESEERLQRCCQNPFSQKSFIFSKNCNEDVRLQREEQWDDILKLRSDIFGGRKAGIRSYSKTDRI